MNYKETGFRAFYHHFSILVISEKTGSYLEQFPGSKDADGILTYGYYDREAGMTLEVLAAVTRKGDRAVLDDLSGDVRFFIRAEAVQGEDVLFWKDGCGGLEERYHEKLAALQCYDGGEDLEQTRAMDFLDGSRDPFHIDDLMVWLLKDGRKPEGCWVRMQSLEEHRFAGMLLNEPEGDFGCHAGDLVPFSLQKLEDQTVICVADRNGNSFFTEEELADGSRLEEVVAEFYGERTEYRFFEVMKILRDSQLWVPFTAVLSDRDQKRLEQMVFQREGGPESLKGEVFQTEDETRMVPDILQNGEEYFFPVFSTAEAMGEYGGNFSKVQLPVTDVIRLAENSEKKLSGIVLNAFGKSFVLEREFWDAVEHMKSHLAEETD